MNKETLSEKIAAMEKELAAMKAEVNKAETKNIAGATKWLQELLPTLTAKYLNVYIVWRNEKEEWIFQQDYKNGRLWYSYYRVYKILNAEYRMNQSECDELITNVVAEAFKCKQLTPNESK